MAFQPIFDMASGSVFAQEALVRGKDGRSAGQIFEHVTEQNRYRFDQLCRSTAIEVASTAGLTGALSINFMPNAVYEPYNCIQHTLWTAEKFDLDVTNIIFEFTENEFLRDVPHLKNIVDTYQALNFRTAIDDFGSGFSGVSLLADIVPDIVKLDRHLVTGIDRDVVRQKIVRHIKAMTDDLGIVFVAEGVENLREFEQLREMGVSLMQGNHLAKAQVECIQLRPEGGFDQGDLARGGM